MITRPGREHELLVGMRTPPDLKSYKLILTMRTGMKIMDHDLLFFSTRQRYIRSFLILASAGLEPTASLDEPSEGSFQYTMSFFDNMFNEVFLE